VLKFVQHPLMQYYKGTYIDDHFYYLFSDYVNGKELFDALRDIGVLEINEALFYVG